MLEVLEFASHMNLPANEYCVLTSINILESLVLEIGHGTKDIGTKMEVASLPVFTTHCIYKAAIVYLQDARVSGGVDPEPSVSPLKDLLRHIGMRWGAASKFLPLILISDLEALLIEIARLLYREDPKYDSSILNQI